MLSLFWFLLVGLAAGLLARAVLPGRQSMGLPLTLLLGMAGSVVGGFLLGLLTGGLRDRGFDPAGLAGAVAGAVLVLLVFNRLAASAASRAARNGGAERP